jgi:phosphate transport system permease protein
MTASVSSFGRPMSAKRRRKDRIALVGMYAAVLLSLVPLALILYFLIIKGIGAMSWEFLTSSQPLTYVRPGGGALNAVIGTGYMVGLASLLSIPLGVGAAVYLNEYGEGRFAFLVRFFTDVMTGVPSVFVGLFVFGLIILETPLGFSAIAGGLALALIMLPIVIRSTEEILKLVPQSLRDASYALGATRARTVMKVVLPASRAGITTGVMLAVARAAGETAPLIMTALGSVQLVTAWSAPISALPLYIYQGIKNPFLAGQERAFAAALELVAIVLIFTVVARWIAGRQPKGSRS